MTRPDTDAIGARPRFVRAGLLIDGNGGAPVPDAVVEIEDGRIVRVGRADEFGTALDDAAVLDHAGRVVMPGLVDCHAHPTLYPDRQSFEVQLQAPDEMLALTAVHQLTRHLKSGVTTIRDCAARGQVMFWVREAIRRGYFPGPRLQLAGRAITHSRGHIHWAGGVADTADEIRREVRVLVAEGADVIKVVASGGGTKGGIPYLASYTTDELRVAVEAAHALERPTVAHARATQSIENCVDAGIDAIAHVEFLAPGEIVDMGGAGAPTGLPNLDRARRREARGLAGLPRPQPPVERLGHAGPLQGEDRQRRGADRRRAGPAGQPPGVLRPLHPGHRRAPRAWGWWTAWASARTPARSTPSSATWSTASRSRGWPGSRRWSRCRS